MISPIKLYYIFLILTIKERDKKCRKRETFVTIERILGDFKREKKRYAILLSGGTMDQAYLLYIYDLLLEDMERVVLTYDCMDR